MEELNEFIKKLTKQTDISYDRLPDIDLYMDQVIEYLTKQCSTDSGNDKISGAMINNYIKDKLLPRANDKRYGKTHLAYLMMIMRLKQVLAVKDIGTVLSAIPQDDIQEYFNNFQSILYSNVNELSAVSSSEESELRIAALNFAITAYVNKTACEIILNTLNNKE